MSNKTKTAMTTTATSSPATEPSATTPAKPETEAKVVYLSVKAGQKYRGARQAWYERLVSLSGKPRAEVLKSLEDKRPSNYGAKSKHHGQPEPVAGWVRFFERTGVVVFK